MAQSLEASIQEIGQAIFRNMPKESPSVFKKDFWNGKIMEWSMRDEAFKVEMFRFVDVFPVLQTPESIARHIQEYFCREDQDFPALIQFGLKQVSPGSLIAKTAAKQIDKNIKGMAYGFVAGEDAKDALPRIKKMRKNGLAFTVDLLGESTVSEAEAEDYQRRYMELIGTLADAAADWKPDPLLDSDPHGAIPRVNVSIKISALFSQIDPLDPAGSIAGVKARLLPLFELAKARGVFLNLDMEQYELKDLTLALFKDLMLEPSLEGWSDAGVVIQAYLRDSLADTHALCAWARETGKRISVRLVKGAYWDYETLHAQQHGWPIPVYQNKWETDANYEACAKVLLDHHAHLRTSIASHNVRSMACAMAYAQSLGIPPSGLELQMLYGMAEPMKKGLRSMGYRVRDYVPVGELVPGMAYLVRRLLENTSNEGFLRAKFVEDVDPATLLQAPASKGQDVPDPSPTSEFLNEAHTDFAKADRRQAFAAAISSVRGQLGAHYPMVIGGEERRGETALHSKNPSRAEELVGTVACATREDAESAIRSSYGAFPAWSQRTASERAAYLRRLADVMRARRDELSAWMVFEVGKNWREADADTAEAIDFCDYYAQEAERLMSAPKRLGNYPGELNQLFYQPMGVGVVIAPWNFPLAILTGMTMAAVAAGNCAVMKPAEQSPVIAAKLMELIREAGFPDGVVNFLPGIGEDVGAYLVEHPWTRFIAFTGSRDVGLHILRTAYTTRPDRPA